MIDHLGKNTAATTQRGEEIVPNRGVRQFPRRPNHNFISKNRVPHMRFGPELA